MTGFPTPERVRGREETMSHPLWVWPDADPMSGKGLRCGRTAPAIADGAACLNAIKGGAHTSQLRGYASHPCSAHSRMDTGVLGR